MQLHTLDQPKHSKISDKKLKKKYTPTNANDKQELSLWINIKSTFQLCLTFQPNQFFLLFKRTEKHTNRFKTKAKQRIKRNNPKKIRATKLRGD